MPARVFLAVVLAAVFSSVAEAQDDLHKAQSLVAMLQSMDAEGNFDGTLCAAGLVLSSTQDRTLLLTAQHVLGDLDQANENRHRVSAPPLTLAAQFLGAVGRYYKVRRLPGLSSSTLDYAVLEVVPIADSPVPAPQSWAMIGSTLDVMKSTQGKLAFQTVRAIGNNQCQPWLASASTEKILEENGTQIVFETRFVDKGNSGGGLFAADGGLVGMVTETTGDKGAALKLDIILAELAAKHVEIGWTDKIYGQPNPESHVAGQSVADTAKISHLNVILIEVLETRAKYRLSKEGFPARPIHKVVAVAGRSQSPDNEFSVPFADALAGETDVEVMFSDGSTTNVPTDLKAPLLAKIKELANDGRDWFKYPGGDARIFFKYPTERGLVRSARAGFSPSNLEYHFNTPEEDISGSTAKIPLNAVGIGQGIRRPSENRALWYEVTFIDGTTTGIRKFSIADEAIYDIQSRNYLGIHIARSEYGEVFPYYFHYGFNGQFPWGAINLLRPYGMKTFGNLQYDADGRGFVDGYGQRTYGVEEPIPWTTGSIKVRYINPTTGKIVGPFTISGFETSAIRDATQPNFPQIDCRSLQNPTSCEFSDPKALGHVREFRFSFSSVDKLKAAKLGDLTPLWNRPDGVALLGDCDTSRTPKCHELNRKLGLAWDIPTGATDFFYSVVMRDGRILTPQRIPIGTINARH